MKILFHGNKERGSAMMFVIVLISVFLFVFIPLMNFCMVKFSYEKRTYEKYIEKINEHNDAMRLYEAG